MNILLLTKLTIMSKVYEFFKEGYRIPVGEYGNLVFENSHIAIYSKKNEGEVTTTAFSLDNDNRLVKKTMTSKIVKVTEQWEEVIETTNAKVEIPSATILANLLKLSVEEVVTNARGNFHDFCELVYTAAHSQTLDDTERSTIASSLTALEKEIFAMQA